MCLGIVEKFGVMVGGGLESVLDSVFPQKCAFNNSCKVCVVVHCAGGLDIL